MGVLSHRGSRVGRQAVRLGIVLLWLTAACSGRAEPPAPIPYVNRRTGECGVLWEGLRDQQRTPRDRGFERMVLPRKPALCKSLLDKLRTHPQAPKQLEEDVTHQSPCERLPSSLPNSMEGICEALGYRYVGELPVSTRPCYPNLAPFLGASCAPLIWIHLAVLVGVLGFVGALAYVMLTRRAKRRRALAAAAEDAPPRSQAYR